MNVYDINDIGQLLSSNDYPGRGVIIGLSENGKYAVTAYFIMGRSENSRNRVFCEKDGGEVIIYPFDASKVEDPSLIIYSPIKKYKNSLIVTNGDQTDTIYDGLADGISFETALDRRCFEPDKPNFTPRISGILDFSDGFKYKLNILKSADAEGTQCNRYTFSYSPACGLGHFIHTYNCNGNPIPTFTGEPERIAVENDIDAFADKIWTNLNKDNKISLYVRYIELESGNEENRLFNKNGGND